MNEIGSRLKDFSDRLKESLDDKDRQKSNDAILQLRKDVSGKVLDVRSHEQSIDINPVQNPWVREDSENSFYDPSKRGTLHADSAVVKIFREDGWKWGGNWENSKDWMHFYRPEIGEKYYGKTEVEE